MSSVRDYAILWVGARAGAGGSGGTALGGNALLTTPQHALDGPEHTAATDQTRLDASVDAHGLLPKLSGDPAEFLDGTGAWSEAALTVKDEGTPLPSAATSVDFVGAGVVASGTGSAKTVTIPGTPTGAAGGALAGTYPNPTLVATAVRDAGHWDPVVDDGTDGIVIDTGTHTVIMEWTTA